MKPLMLTRLLLILAPLQTFAATNCKIVEFPERNELICVGDEIAKPEPTVPAKPLRSTSVETFTQNQFVAPQMPEPAPAAAMAQAPLPSESAAPQTGAPVNAGNKAAEDLAKRRELATRNTRNLKSYTSATALPAK